MTCLSESEANQSHNSLALVSFMYTVVKVFSVRSLNYRDRDIQRLIRCHRRNRKHCASRWMSVMQNVVGRQKMCTSEPFWTGETSLFKQTTLPCSYVFTDNRHYEAVNREIWAGPHGLTSLDWCIIDVGQLNNNQSRLVHYWCGPTE